jgi:lipopolysaccharide cholinephosphotransferase
MDKKLINVKDFSPEELRKWQMKLLDILVYFRDFCDSHNLKFMLAAGTCLGAVRHKGFIPWDDDLDVQMPREDYDRLIEIWNKEADTTKFVCLSMTKDQCTKFPIAVIKNENTTCIYEHSADLDISQGLKIDVEFLDGVPDNIIIREFNHACALLFSLFRAQRIPHRNIKIKIFVSRLLLWLVPSHKMRWIISSWCERRMKKYKFGEQKYVRYASNALRPTHCFDEIIYVDFEGYKMPIPKGYDEVLRAAYGDYMQLPPIEQRKPATDNLIFYDLDNSYKKYRGIYYYKQ